MLYAATRNALTKALGSDRFTDTMFATNEVRDLRRIARLDRGSLTRSLG
jgi:hypothetical protein